MKQDKQILVKSQGQVFGMYYPWEGDRTTSVFLYRIVQKPANANPGLKVYRSIDFSGIPMFFIAYVV